MNGGGEEIGVCYPAAFEFICLAYGAAGLPKGMRLVHGRPHQSRAPFEKMGHAWIEFEGSEVVIDPSHAMTTGAIVTSKKRYYQIGRIDPAENFYYTQQQAIGWSELTGHYGPWEGIEAEALRDACRARGGAIAATGDDQASAAG